jgi:ATP-dependent RNA helicase SUPV3L1/SUV3
MADHPEAPDAPAEADPDLVHEIARQHPDCLTLADAGLTRIELAGQAGLAPLGLPLPRGKRDLLVPVERREAVVREIQGQLDRVRRRNELLAAARRILDGAHVSLHPGDARDRVRLVMTDELPWTGMTQPIRFVVSRLIDVDELSGLRDVDLQSRLSADGILAERLHEDAGVSPNGSGNIPRRREHPMTAGPSTACAGG